MRLWGRFGLLSAILGITSTASSIAGETASYHFKAPAQQVSSPLLKPTLDTRLRYEFGEQDGLGASHALTWRNRIGVQTRDVYGFKAMAEYEGILVSDRDSFRAASVHGPADKTVIVGTAESHEFNRFWLSYTTPEKLVEIKVGRQAIALGNQRHIGMGPWRQNLQTYDAAAITLRPVKDLSLYYAYVDRVHPNFGSEVFLPIHRDFEGSTHLFNASYRGLPDLELSVFSYLMDLNNAAGSNNSNHSTGLSLDGAPKDSPLRYHLEYAYQTDAEDSALDYATHYAHGMLSVAIGSDDKLDVGLEYLGADNGTGYNFPLSSKHKSNGLADLFLATPADGLSDLYLAWRSTLPGGITSNLAYHHFWDSQFGTTLGDEIDLVLSKDLGGGWKALAHAAYFIGQSGYPDTTRGSVQLGYQF